jgi:hypothetical protein
MDRTYKTNGRYEKFVENFFGKANYMRKPVHRLELDDKNQS